MLEKSPLSVADGIGTVYFEDDVVYRVVHNDRQDEVRRLLDSGLIQRLADENLFPATRISERRFDDHELVLEHEKISPIIYPYEWSPEMVRRAGLFLLNINRIANSYGYELKDAHPYNLVYRNSTPVLVDFGSLVGLDGTPGWRAHSEFKQCYVYPLKAYRLGMHQAFKAAFLNDGNGITSADFYLMKHPLLRALGYRRLTKFFRYWRAYLNPRILTEEVIKGELRHDLIRRVARFVARNRNLPFRSVNYVGLEKKLARIRIQHGTRWSNYHSELQAPNGGIDLPPRLGRIVTLAGELTPTIVLDLAGNQGALARSIALLPSVRQVVCADYDEGAIDMLMASIDSSEAVLPAVFNMMGDAHQAETLARYGRLKADLVIALAVTHHLILGQNYNLQAIIDTVARFTSSILMIEFMPMGLYDGFNQPVIPWWYTEEWFEQALQKRFIVIRKEKLEVNRMLYIGKLRES